MQQMSKPLQQEFDQATQYESPWTIRTRLGILAWELCWTFLCRWTPKPLNRWRLFWLKLFGCKVFGRPFVHQRARIAIPWNLELHDRACLGDGAHAYSLGPIEIHEHATIAQEAYLCTGTHAFDKPSKNLVVAKIKIGKHAFIGARAFILPGVEVGENAIVGACAVVSKNVLDGHIVVGNPATIIKQKERVNHEFDQ
jgi:putative colanic acid biosynthesis acetyltransferase WcaF